MLVGIYFVPRDEYYNALAQAARRAHDRHNAPQVGMLLKESLAFRVVASSYEEEVKAALGQLVNVLGGEVSLRLSRRNTHLLVPFAVGDKYLGCADRGVTPVTMEWLLQSAQAGGPPLSACGDLNAGARGGCCRVPRQVHGSHTGARCLPWTGTCQGVASDGMQQAAASHSSAEPRCGCCRALRQVGPWQMLHAATPHRGSLCGGHVPDAAMWRTLVRQCSSFALECCCLCQVTCWTPLSSVRPRQTQMAPR